jgi:tetratricopeptide (TPR) repeat protein
MNSAILGIVIVLTVVIVQVLLRQWKMVRLKNWWHRGDEAFKAGSYQDAERSFRACVKILPLWIPARTMLAVTLSQQGRLAEAEEQMKLSAELEPRRAEGHVDLGLFYAIQFKDRIEDAIAAFERAVSLRDDLRGELAREPRLRPLLVNPRFKALLDGTARAQS